MAADQGGRREWPELVEVAALSCLPTLWRCISFRSLWQRDDLYTRDSIRLSRCLPALQALAILLLELFGSRQHAERVRDEAADDESPEEHRQDHDLDHGVLGQLFPLDSASSLASMRASSASSTAYSAPSIAA